MLVHLNSVVNNNKISIQSNNFISVSPPTKKIQILPQYPRNTKISSDEQNIKIVLIYTKQCNQFEMSYLSKTCILILIGLFTCILAADKLPIHQTLFGISLKGSWRISNNKKGIFGINDYNKPDTQAKPQSPQDENKQEDGPPLMNFFTNTKGNVEVLITQPKENSINPYVYIQLLNSKYVNDEVVQLSFSLDKGYNKTLDEWKTPKFLTPVRLFNNFQQIVTYDVKLNFQMKRNLNNEIQIALISDSLSVDLFIQPLQFSIWHFVMFFGLNIVQIVLLIYFGGHQNTLANTSAWLLLQSCLFLVFQSIFLFRIAMGYYDTKLSWLFLAFVTNLSVMMLILWKFTAVIEKFRNRLQFLLGILFTIAYFVLVYTFYTKGGFWILEFNVFMWQICYSIYRGGAGGVSKELVITVLLSRLPLLVFLKSQDNLLKLKPDPLAFNFAVTIMTIHLLIILLQKRYGARFFTPVSIIPNYFNYLCQAFFGDQICSTECSICFNELREKPNSPAKSIQQKQKEMKQRKNEKVKYVYTQCKHSFHQECLKDWLNVHLVCPNCRSGLPPMNLGAA